LRQALFDRRAKLFSTAQGPRIGAPGVSYDRAAAKCPRKAIEPQSADAVPATPRLEKHGWFSIDYQLVVELGAPRRETGIAGFAPWLLCSVGALGIVRARSLRLPWRNKRTQIRARSAISAALGKATLPIMAARCGSMIIMPRSMPAATRGLSSSIDPRPHCREKKRLQHRLGRQDRASA
jgi:hypothetical protein